MTAPETLKTTPLHALHRELGAEFGGFAGYDMPIRYPAGIMAEHLHCRASAAMFDVSHMGQVLVKGPGVIAALERLVPGDIEALKAMFGPTTAAVIIEPVQGEGGARSLD